MVYNGETGYKVNAYIGGREFFNDEGAVFAFTPGGERFSPY